MDRFDVIALVGLLMLGVGLWLASPALALAVVGALLIAFGVLGASRRRVPAKRGEG